MRRFLPCFLLMFIAATEIARSEPIPLPNQFPLAQLHASMPVTAVTIAEKGSLSASSRFAWSNSLNVEGSQFLIDAETRSLYNTVRYGLLDSVELSATLPVYWRGAGALDGVIDSWHQAFGLPRGDRDKIPDNHFALTGVTDSGKRFSLRKKNVALGDLVIRSKYQLSESLALRGLLQLPTGSEQFGQDSVDVGLGVASGIELGRTTILAGSSYIYFADPSEGALRYQQHHYSAYIAGLYQFIENFNGQLGLQFESELIENVSGLSQYALYLDLGLSYTFSNSTALELLLREDPTPNNLSTDVSFLIGLQVSM